MMNLFETLRFLKVMIAKTPPAIEPYTMLLQGEHYAWNSDIYLPPPGKKIKGTILFAHGMNKLGNKDPRMMGICKTAAYCGYISIAPTYPLITQHIVDNQSADEFEETIAAITKDPKLCPQGKIGIFTASFSGSFCMRAIKRPSIANKVSSLCSVGIAYHARSTFKNILAETGDDLYAKFIGLKNLWRVQGELDPMREKLIDLAIDDAFDPSQKAKVPDYLANLAEPERNHLAKLIEGVYQRQDLSPYYLDHIETTHQQFMQDADPSGLKAYITLIHSETDQVLHPVESQLLYQALQKAGIKSKLLLTPLLDHADMNMSLKQLKDIVLFILALHHFLSHI